MHFISFHLDSIKLQMLFHTHSYYHGPLDMPLCLDLWLPLRSFFAPSQQELAKDWISTSHLPNGSKGLQPTGGRRRICSSPIT
jgi:hypothetical protein